MTLSFAELSARYRKIALQTSLSHTKKGGAAGVTHSRQAHIDGLWFIIYYVALK